MIRSMEKKIIKKNIFGVISYLVLEGLFLKGISHIKFDSLEVIDVVNLIGAVIVLALALKTIFYPYLIVQNGSISILRDFLYKESFSIGDVASINIGDSPFSKSNFELKNSKKIKFDSFAISKENLGYLERLCKGTQ
jgi:uncharacterized YccA/Bax inhibitor family protein